MTQLQRRRAACCYIGSKGKLMHETYGFNPRLLPQSLHDSRQADADAAAHPDDATR